MRIRIVKNEGDRLEMAVGGEGHTLLNLLQNSLLKNKDVKMAGYSKPHPLMDRSVLYVNMEKGKSPEKALLAAVEDAKRQVNEFLAEFNSRVAELKTEQ